MGLGNFEAAFLLFLSFQVSSYVRGTRSALSICRWNTCPHWSKEWHISNNKNSKKKINDAIGHSLAAFHPSLELTALYWCWLSCTHRPLETAIKYTSYKSWIVMVYQTILARSKQAQPYQQKSLASCSHMFDWSNESRLEIITWHHTRTRDPESCKIWETLQHLWVYKSFQYRNSIASLQLSTPSPSEPVICHQLARFPRALDLWMSLCHLCLVQCYSIRQARGASVAVSWIFLMFDDVWWCLMPYRDDLNELM